MPLYCGISDIFCGNVTPELVDFIPNIKLVGITPNPVNQNTSFTIEVITSEIEVLVVPIIIYCGVFNCGQEILM